MQLQSPGHRTGVNDLLGENHVVDERRLAAAAKLLRNPDTGDTKATELGIQSLGDALRGLPLGYVRHNTFGQEGSHRAPKSFLLIVAGATPHDVPLSVERAPIGRAGGLRALETERIGSLGRSCLLYT